MHPLQGRYAKTCQRLLALSTVCLLLAIGFYAARPAIVVFVRNRTEEILQEQFVSRIEFADFQVSVRPMLRVTVTHLILRYHGRQDIPPLFQIAELSLTTRLWSIFRPRIHISTVRLTGLQITLPTREPGSPPVGTNAGLKSKYPVVIELLQTNDAKITLLRGQPGQLPLEFPLHHLELSNLSFEKPVKFKATLTNAVPKGELEANGLFGPWNAGAPRATAVQGNYRLDHAELATIKGLQGILSSTGTFSGTLDYLYVKGTTDSPDFSLRSVHNPLALHTDYTATVDGTNGNTYLESVIARFRRSTLFIKGEVVDMKQDVRGRTIHLDASSDDARIEDLIRLTRKSNEPILNGRVQLAARIDIPEAEVGLSKRLKIASQFAVDQGHFTNASLQEKVDSLSRKGQGAPNDNGIANVPLQLTGTLRLEKGIIHFSALHFIVAGATVDLHGAYIVAEGTLDFHGDMLLDVKLSQTTTGAKSVLLKAIDPFFSGKNGGSALPIKIGGTREQPKFGLDRRKNRE